MPFFSTSKPPTLPTAQQALPGRDTPMPVAAKNIVLQSPMTPPFAENTSRAIFAMGCFWGVEKLFWQVTGVVSTAVGYAGGLTKNPLYEEVCSGQTGHTEVVLVVFDGTLVSYETLLQIFWTEHNPTEGMRQGPDTGTQYRSAIYTTTDLQQQAALQSRTVYQQSLTNHGYGKITTQIAPSTNFYYAEDYHQQYLAKNPFAGCSLRGTGLAYPT